MNVFEAAVSCPAGHAVEKRLHKGVQEPAHKRRSPTRNDRPQDPTLLQETDDAACLSAEKRAKSAHLGRSKESNRITVASLSVRL
jgi:hypothetical protein